KRIGHPRWIESMPNHLGGVCHRPRWIQLALGVIPAPDVDIKRRQDAWIRINVSRSSQLSSNRRSNDVGREEWRISGGVVFPDNADSLPLRRAWAKAKDLDDSDCLSTVKPKELVAQHVTHSNDDRPIRGSDGIDGTS